VTPLLAALVLVATALICGWIAERLKQPPLLGHMLAGILSGPLVLDVVRATPQLAALSDIAVLFVVVAAGLEMRVRHVVDVFRGRGLLALLPSFLLPAAGGALFAGAAGLPARAAIVVGLCTSVTALPVALRILAQAGMLQTRIAAVSISAALVGDVIVLLGLVAAGGQVGVPYAVIVFLVALAVSDVVNAVEWGRRVRHWLEAISGALLAPFFLAYQGTQVVPSGVAGFTAGLVVVAIAAKLAGGYVTGVLSGMSRRDATGVAIVVNARGLMEIVIATIAYRAGLVDVAVFSGLLVMGTVTTLCTPPLLAHWQRRADG
jgi:Kef-type K+ transport system membrane component KefB